MESPQTIKYKNMENNTQTTQTATDMEAAETLKTAKDNILTETQKANHRAKRSHRATPHRSLLTGALLTRRGTRLSRRRCSLARSRRSLNSLLIAIQFTPDLMPSDIIGTDIIEEGEAGKRAFRFIKGPVFANIVLADEINRTPPKTQAALLQAMQEYKVTAGGRTYALERPFFVLATQNPIEQEGTYPLPEAQLDRFMFHITIDYPDKDAEKEIVMTTTAAYEPEIKAVITGEEVLQIQQVVRKVPNC